MKIKLITKIWLIILCITFTHSAHPSYIKNDKIIAKTNERVTLKSTIKTHSNIVKLFTSLRSKINKSYLKNEILKEIKIINAYPELFKNYKAKIDKESLELMYKDHAKRKNISLLNLKKLIEKKYKIKNKTLTEFIANNIAFKNARKMAIAEELIVSDAEISNFFNVSNYKKYNKNLYTIKFLEVSFSKRKNKKNSLEILRKLTKDLTDEKIDEIKKNPIFLYRELDLNQENKHFSFLKEYMDNNLKNDVIGPVLFGNYIYMFKLIEKQNNTDNYKPFIKIKYKTLQKKKFTATKNTKKFLNLENEITKEQINKYMKSSKKTYWAYKDTTDPILYDRIRKLKLNEISDVIETKTGWYIIKVIDRTFDQKSNIYNYIVDKIMLEKIKLLTQQFENKITKNINIKYYK